MCGFVGIINKNGNNKFELDMIKKNNNIAKHRGPDDSGYYIDESISFGFRRLSIIDLENGHQPFFYDDERYVLIFNGEIYNYIEIREELLKKNIKFTTKSDTEVIVALYSEKKESCVDYLRGMYSFLIWDKVKKSLFGARDHFGIKPLCYCETKENIYFASERKSIDEFVIENGVDKASLQHYFTYQYVPEPHNIVDKVKKIPAAHYISFKNGDLEIKKYWDPKFNPIKKSKSYFMKEIKDTMENSVKVHMRSDVPVGCFLSGGIDSTIIASICKDINPNILTFTVGFESKDYSEYEVAAETAKKLNVKNIYKEVSPEEYINELPKIIWHLDDPLADPSCIPLYFLAKEARKYVTVVLSGEGSDELFGGYNIYREPISLRPFNYIPNCLKDKLKVISAKLAENVKGKSFIERGCTGIEERYYGNARLFMECEKKVFIKNYSDNVLYTDITSGLYDEIKNYSDVNKMQYIDMHTWLKGDILLKADKMTMANSLELRVPFLDKEVFRIASKIPQKLKINSTTTKYVLREAFKNKIPGHVVNRRKLGFPVPMKLWLKKELRDWSKELINKSKTDYLIDKDYILMLLHKHSYEKVDYSRKIWSVLIFMLWHSIFIDKEYSKF
ncbi:MAG: asparagine synthase (glutamine-hydrolyzing) [Clostridiales bacterium]